MNKCSILFLALAVWITLLFCFITHGDQLLHWFSARHCDDDEKGVRYIVFCHVILGNVEVVSPGCGPYRPSSVNFDSGVDDLHNPSQYIVWNMNMKSHIFPEYVVSFKISSSPLERGKFSFGCYCSFLVYGITIFF